MTDVLVDGRVIPVPPGWVIRVTLERVADGAHPTTTRGGDAAYREAVKEPHDGGARRPGTEREPTIDELDPLPVMAKRNGSRNGNGLHDPPRLKGNNGKLCPECTNRCGPRSRACQTCGHHFLHPAKKA